MFSQWQVLRLEPSEKKRVKGETLIEKLFLEPLCCFYSMGVLTKRVLSLQRQSTRVLCRTSQRWFLVEVPGFNQLCWV